ncbi:MAG: HAD family phosphatase, partial [Proteobacteria bacterium]|nr:HAD family phosphatase [Pseudomonadota bacterium]
MPELTSLKALLFDLDGTLTDTDDLHFDVWRAMLAEQDLRIDRGYFDEHLSGGSNDEILQRIVPKFSEAERAAFAAAKERAFRQSATALTPTPGLGRVLDWAATLGLKTAVVTSAEPENVEFMLGALDLRDRFETIVMAGDAAFAKPHPMPFEMACGNLGVSP